MKALRILITLVLFGLFTIACGEDTSTTPPNENTNNTNNICVEGDCGGHGVCYIENSEPNCVCDDGYVFFKGYCVENRKPSVCDNNTCEIGSYCVDLGDSYDCACDVGYHKKDNHCIKNITCDDVICGNNAHCVVIDNEHTQCECDENYIKHDSICISVDSDPCDSVTCDYEHPTCVSLEDYNYKCVCIDEINEPTKENNHIAYNNNVICNGHLFEDTFEYNDNVIINKIHFAVILDYHTTYEHMPEHIDIAYHDGDTVVAKLDYGHYNVYVFDNSERKHIIKISYTIPDTVNHVISHSLSLSWNDRL